MLIDKTFVDIYILLMIALLATIVGMNAMMLTLEIVVEIAADYREMIPVLVAMFPVLVAMFA